MAGVAEANLTNAATCSDVTTAGRLLTHLREPQNLLNYMLLSAWLKFMNVTTMLPTIVIA
jgi:hypothetical protein